MIIKRINNLAFCPCTYLCNPPKTPNFEIVKYVDNPYYQRESNFIKEGDFYRPKDETYNYVRIHKNCFKNPESRYTVAEFKYEENAGDYSILCYSHITEFNDTEMLNFRDLVTYGITYLKELNSLEE